MKAQQAPCPVSGVIDADARRGHDPHCTTRRRGSDEQVIAQQVVAVESLVDAHGAAEQRRPLRAFFQVLHRFQRAQQHGGSVQAQAQKAGGDFAAVPGELRNEMASAGATLRSLISAASYTARRATIASATPPPSTSIMTADSRSS